VAPSFSPSSRPLHPCHIFDSFALDGLLTQIGLHQPRFNQTGCWLLSPIVPLPPDSPSMPEPPFDTQEVTFPGLDGCRQEPGAISTPRRDRPPLPFSILWTVVLHLHPPSTGSRKDSSPLSRLSMRHGVTRMPRHCPLWAVDMDRCAPTSYLLNWLPAAISPSLPFRPHSQIGVRDLVLTKLQLPSPPFHLHLFNGQVLCDPTHTPLLYPFFSHRLRSPSYGHYLSFCWTASKH